MSLYKDASLVMIPSAVKDGRLYSMRPIPEYGAEEVTNGDFATDSNWTKASGSTISGGSLNIVAAPYNANTRQSLSLTNGTTYEIVINAIAVGSATDNTFQLGFADSAGNPSDTTQQEFAVGTSVKKLIVTASATDSAIIFRSRDAGTSNLSITNVSVKEVLKPSGDFTFSRGSNLAATRVDVNGLIEKGRENLFVQSNQFDTTWILGSATITGGQSGYDGTNNAWKLQDTAVSAEHFVRQTPNVGNIVSVSVYAKANTLNFLWLRSVEAGVNKRTWFDLSSGSVGTSQGIDANIESVGNGWYRCSATFNHQAAFEYYIAISDANGSSSYAGTGNGSIYIQDAQLEQGLVATDYIETGASTAQAGILEDLPRLDYSGGASCPSLLLEPQRSNLVTQSEYFGSSYWIKNNISLVDNATTSPEGLVNAVKIVEDTSNNYHRTYSSQISVSASTNTCFSVFAKKGEKKYVAIGAVWNSSNGVVAQFDLEEGSLVYSGAAGAIFTYVDSDIVALENDWYKISIVAQTTQTIINFAVALSDGIFTYPSIDNVVNIYTGDGTSGVFIYGAQVEAGSYPTSYIPTYGGSAVTRSEDESGTSAISGLVGANGGSLFLEISYLELNPSSRLSLSDGTYNNLIYSRTQTSGRIQFLGGDLLLQAPSGFASLNTFYKVAIGFEENNAVLYIDGVQIDTDTSFTMPSGLEFFAFGTTDSSINPLRAEIKQVLVFPTRLTNAELAALTA